MNYNGVILGYFEKLGKVGEKRLESDFPSDFRHRKISKKETKYALFS